MSEAATAISQQTKTKAKFAICLTLFTAGVGNSFIFAILPPLGREIGFAEVQIGAIISCSATVFMFTAPIWGRVSEVWGRRRIILFAMMAYCVMTILFARVVQLSLDKVLPVTLGYILLLLCRCTFTLGIGGMFPSSQAYMADITEPHERTAGMSLVGMASGLGSILGPGLAAFFAGFGILIPYYAVAGLAVVAGMVVWAFVVDVPREERPHDERHESLMTRTLVPFFILSTILMAALACMQQSMGFYLQDTFDLSTAETTRKVGWVLIASAVSSVFAQLIFVQRLKLEPRMLMRAGVPLILIGIIGFAMSGSYSLMVAAMFFFGVGFGMVMPGNVASISMSVTGYQQGRVAGLNTSAQGAGFIIGPLLGSGLYQINHRLPFAICGMFIVIAMCMVYFVVKIPDAGVTEEVTET